MKRLTRASAPARLPADYRYTLHRVLDAGAPRATCAFIMLNPSTADATRDDPTIRRCIGFARAWGFRHLRVVNLFALRSTDPRGLLAVPDPIGPHNDRHLARIVREAELVIAAWGVAAPIRRLVAARAAAVRALLPDVALHSLRLTRSGAPAHPLYLPRGLQPRAGT